MKKKTEKKRISSCDICMNYTYDEDYECYTFEVDLDEDEMAHFMQDTYYNCPYFQMGDEYKMPPVGAEVLVLHLSNGCAAGVVMGRYWNEANKPSVSGKGVFRKELGEKKGEAYIQYKDGNMTLKDGSGTTTLGSILKRLSNLEARL